jgi:polyvinyl alcohol dehydrogenase (cytochrome)
MLIFILNKNLNGNYIKSSKKSKKPKNATLSKLAIALIAVAAIIVLVLLLDSLYPSGSGGNWTTFTLNSNNSRYQSNTSITSVDLPMLRQKWVIYTNSYVTSTPVVLDGNVYFADWNGSVYSANVINGTINWKVNLGYPISSTPTLSNGVVYIGLGPLGQTKVYALSQKNGSIVWSTTINSTERAIWGSPTVFRGLVYIGVAGAGDPAGQVDTNASKVGQLYALNSTTGAVEWNFTTEIGNSGGAAVWSSVVTDPNLNSIYFGTGNAYTNNSSALYAYAIISLNATTGKLNWAYRSYNTKLEGDDLDFGSTPNLFSMQLNGTTYNAIGDGSKDGNYYILNRINGTLLEKFPIGTAGSNQGIVGLSGFIYNQKNDPEIFVPSFYNVSQQCCGVVDAISPSNKSIDWSFYTNGNIRGSVTIIPGAVLVGDNSGDMYAISTTNGHQLYYRQFSDGIDGGITVAEGYVFVPTSLDGPTNSTGVYAFTT